MFLRAGYNCRPGRARLEMTSAPLLYSAECQPAPHDRFTVEQWPGGGGGGREALPAQGYLAHNPPPTSEDPTVGLCLGPYGGPGGRGVFPWARYTCFGRNVNLQYTIGTELSGGLVMGGVTGRLAMYRGTSLVRNVPPVGFCFGVRL